MMNSELRLRWKKVQEAMKTIQADGCVIASNTNLYYLSGMVFGGYIYLPQEGDPLFFIRRPVGLTDPQWIYFNRMEDITNVLKEKKIRTKHLLLEADQLTYSDYIRVQSTFQPETTGNASPLIRTVRTIKSAWEIGQFRISAQKHTEVYRKIADCYYPGIKDLEFQTNIETQMRMNGSLGFFRSFGSNMDIHMGSVLVGDNAGEASPFDFALGGAGMHPSLPIGANGTTLKEGTTVMVDMAGNYTAYISDITRVFAIGELPDIACQSHQVSIDIQDEFIRMSKPGTSCADIYNMALDKVNTAGLSNYFMGTKQQAKFVGHGVGIEINELPILMGRSKDVLQAGMVIALEPKFVIPGIGGTGIENTFLVTETGVEKLTVLEEKILQLK